TLFVALELMVISIYILSGFLRRCGGSRTAPMKCLAPGAFSCAGFWVAVWVPAWRSKHDRPRLRPVTQLARPPREPRGRGWPGAGGQGGGDPHSHRPVL